MQEIPGSKKITPLGLLGVAVIIGLVGAIIFPVLTRGRKTLREGNCLTNLQQIGKATQMYLQDHDNVFPPATTGLMDSPMHAPWTSYNGRLVSWYWLLEPYLKTGMAHDAGWTYVDVVGNPATPQSEGVDDSYRPERLGAPWHCPLDSEGVNMSYGVNGMVAGMVNYWNITPQARMDDTEDSKKLADISDPARIVWAGDTNRRWDQAARQYTDAFPDWMRRTDFPTKTMSKDEFLSWYQNYLTADYTDYHGDCPMPSASGCRGPAYRHGRTGPKTGSMNVVFCDGHVKAIPFGQLSLENIVPDLTTAQIAAVKPFKRPAPLYTITDIGSLASGHCMHAGAISGNGMVVGGSDPIPNTWKADAILWKDGNIQDLGKLPGGDWSCAYGVNNKQQVAGELTDAQGLTHAFIWENDKMRALEDLPGFTFSVARAINEKGQIVGRAYNADGGKATDASAHAYLWEKGRMRDLGVPPNCRSTWAYGINNTGDVVGSAITNDDHTHAFLWKNGKMQDIGTLPGGTLSKAFGINDKGQIVGDSDCGLKTAAGNYIFHAFLWEHGVMRDLGVLPGFERCQPVGINNNGQIIGNATTTGWTSCPFVWDQKHGMRLLSTLIPDNQATYLFDAYAINDRGQMVCRMIHKDMPQRLALLTPVDNPSRN